MEMNCGVRESGDRSNQINPTGSKANSIVWFLAEEIFFG